MMQIKKKTIEEIFWFLVVFLLLFLVYKTNFNHETESDYDKQISNSSFEGVLGDNFSKIDEVHFSHMPINYFLDIGAVGGDEDEYEALMVISALKAIENSTGNLVQFRQVKNPEDADLLIYGIPPENNSDDRFITEGLAGPMNMSNNVIKKAGVILYASKYILYAQDSSFFIRDGELWESTEYNPVDVIGWRVGHCKDFPQTEVHEILHTFGLGHKYDNSHSVMAPIIHPIQSCKIKELDKEIVSCLEHIYSNGGKEGNCSNLEMYPWGEEQEPADFKWESLPISYSIHNCSDTQKWNLQKAENVIEKYTGHDIYKFQEDGNGQINFYCGQSFEEVLLNKETDFWDSGNYFPAAQPYFYFNNGTISNVKILLFAQDKQCGGMEVHELLHGVGLKTHYGIWMEQEVEMCDTNNMLMDRKSIDKIKEMYGIKNI